MSAAEFFQAIRDTGPATTVRESALLYPVILSLHLASIAFFGGMILMTDLRLLGIAFRDTPAADVIRPLRVWKRVGFTIMATCGVLLGASKATDYYLNPYFQVKMTLLVLVGAHALIFRRTVYAIPERLDRATAMPAVARVAACLSLALWLGIMTAGRWIAYYEKPRHEDEGVRPAVTRSAGTVLAASVSAPTVIWAAARGRKAGTVSTSSSRITKTVIPSETCNSTIPSSAPAAVRNKGGCDAR
jgi:hypothetical protein